MITDEQLKGNWAEQYIASKLAEQGCLIRHVTQGHDSGIDLYCETIKENSPFLHFWCQVKTSKKWKGKRKKISFPSNQSKNHKDYWLKQPVPVFIFLVPDLRGQSNIPYYICDTFDLIFMDKIISFMKVESSDDLSNFLNESLIIRTFLWDLKNGHVSSLKSPKNEYIKRIRIRPNLAHIFEPNLQRSLLRTMWFLCESIVLYNENLLNISNKQLLDDKDKERLIIVKPYIKALEILINEKNDQHFGHYVTVGKFYELENEYDRSLQYYEKALYIIENEDPNVDPLDPFWKEKCDIIRRHIGRVKSKKDNKNTLFTPVSKTSSYLNH